TETVRNLRLLSKRLRRLFACACCRRLGRRLAPACRRAVEAAERFADGSAGPEELAESGRACRQWEKLGRPVPVEESGDEGGADRAAGFRYYEFTQKVHWLTAPVLTLADA